MKVGLIDVDGHGFPNLALMKLANYYKQRGHDVEWMNNLERYNIVYMSKVFTFTADYQYCINSELLKHKIMETERLFEIIERQTGLTRDILTSRCRNEELVYARSAIVIHLIENGYTFSAAGKKINRSHPTVCYIRKQHEDNMKYNPKYRKVFNEITVAIENNKD